MVFTTTDRVNPLVGTTDPATDTTPPPRRYLKYTSGAKDRG